MLTDFEQYGYLGVFLALLAAGFGFPIPEELPVITAGILTGHGKLLWYIALPVCIFGVVLGDGVLYTVGRVWGQKVLSNPWVQRKLISPEKRAQIEKNFRDRGIIVLLTARMMPGIRSPMFIMAGVLGVPLRRFLLADGIYALPGVSILFFLSYMLTDQVKEVFDQINRHKPLIFVGVLSAVGGIVLYRLATRKVASGDEKDVPKLLRPVEKMTDVLEKAVEKTVDVAIERVKHPLGGERKDAAAGRPPDVPDPPVIVVTAPPPANGPPVPPAPAVLPESPPGA